MAELVKCPKCGFESEDIDEECARCGLIFAKYRAPEPWIETEIPDEAVVPEPDEEEAEEAPVASVPSRKGPAFSPWLERLAGKEPPALDCAACHGQKTMVADAIPKHSAGVRTLGHLVSIITGLGAVVFVIAVAISVATSGLGLLVLGGPMLVGVVVLLAMSLLSSAALSKRRVYRCTSCGHIIERA